MGWTWQHKPYGMKVKDFLIEEFTYENETRKSVVLDIAIVKLRTAYLAVETTIKETGDRKVWAGVVLLGYAPNDHFDLGYKDMDETMGPCETECPERILDLLTPTDSQWANEWREKCRGNLAARAKLRGFIKPGKTYRLKYPARFTDGATLQTVRVKQRKGSAWLVEPEDGWGLYRLGHDRFQGAEVVGS